MKILKISLAFKTTPDTAERDLMNKRYLYFLSLENYWLKKFLNSLHSPDNI